MQRVKKRFSKTGQIVVLGHRAQTDKCTNQSCFRQDQTFLYFVLPVPPLFLPGSLPLCFLHQSHQTPSSVPISWTLKSATSSVTKSQFAYSSLIAYHLLCLRRFVFLFLNYVYLSGLCVCVFCLLFLLYLCTEKVRYSYWHRHSHLPLPFADPKYPCRSYWGNH